MIPTMKSILYLVMVVLSCGWLASCGEKPQPTVQPESPTIVEHPDSPQLKESLEKANRYLANEEEEDIQNYIARHKLDMTSTGTGMRYQVMKPGTGAQIQPGQRVSVEYVLNNIMGDVVYSSENDGIKTFEAGCSDVEAGLDEAILHLHEGDVAKVIIPSHLGYGMQGDQKSIPPRATLIYTLKIIAVK